MFQHPVEQYLPTCDMEMGQTSVFSWQGQCFLKLNVNPFLWRLPVCQSASHPVVLSSSGSHIYLTLQAFQFSTSAINRRGYQIHVRCPLLWVLPNNPQVEGFTLICIFIASNTNNFLLPLPRYIMKGWWWWNFDLKPSFLDA